MAQIKTVDYIAAAIHGVLLLGYTITRNSRILTILTVLLSFCVAWYSIVYGLGRGSLWPLAITLVVGILWWTILARLYIHPRRIAYLGGRCPVSDSSLIR
jgi:lysylphosphatidylglycerol synthetase-like protein (DUF2156 family)